MRWNWIKYGGIDTSWVRIPKLTNSEILQCAYATLSIARFKIMDRYKT